MTSRSQPLISVMLAVVGWLSPLLWLSMHGCGDRPGAVATAASERWLLDPTPLMELGEVDGAPEEVFSRITGLGLLSDGGVVVGNASSGTLRVFDARGAYEREFGGEGQGPGEFAYLGSVHVLRADTMLVYDPVSYRLSTFSRSGELLRTTQIGAEDGAPEVYLGRDESGQHLVSLIRPAQRDPSQVTADLMEVRRYAPDGRDWVSLGTFPGMRRVRSPVPLSPHFLGTMVGDTAFVTDGLPAELDALTPFGTSTRAVQGAEGPWPAAEARQRLAESLEGSAVAERLREASDGPLWDSVPRFSDALADPAGALWLKQYDPRTDSHWVGRRRTGGRWIVSTTQGVQIAVIDVPSGFRLMAVGVDRVAGVQLDDLGVERVVVYPLRREGPGGG